MTIIGEKVECPLQLRSGLDRFGRVVDQLWRRRRKPGDAGRIFLRLRRLGQRHQQNQRDQRGPGRSVFLRRLESADRVGPRLDAGAKADWSLDSLGNDLSSGTYNAVNEETPTGQSSGYDAAGNMTEIPSLPPGEGLGGGGDTAVYDAWNRICRSRRRQRHCGPVSIRRLRPADRGTDRFQRLRPARPAAWRTITRPASRWLRRE